MDRVLCFWWWCAYDFSVNHVAGRPGRARWLDLTDFFAFLGVLTAVGLVVGFVVSVLQSAKDPEVESVIQSEETDSSDELLAAVRAELPVGEQFVTGWSINGRRFDHALATSTQRGLPGFAELGLVTLCVMVTSYDEPLTPGELVYCAAKKVHKKAGMHFETASMFLMTLYGAAIEEGLLVRLVVAEMPPPLTGSSD